MNSTAALCLAARCIRGGGFSSQGQLSGNRISKNPIAVGRNVMRKWSDEWTGGGVFTEVNTS